MADKDLIASFRRRELRRILVLSFKAMNRELEAIRVNQERLRNVKANQSKRRCRQAPGLSWKVVNGRA